LDFLNELFLSSENSYLLVFAIIFVISIIPILTPPTWAVVVMSYTLNPALDAVLLSVIGASAATIGRFLLMRFSSIGRKVINDERKSSLDKLKDYLERKRYGYFLGTMLFALLPLPSNMLFVSYGLMKVRSLQIIAGFWIGRFSVYLLMIYLSKNILVSITDKIDLSFASVIWIDVAGIIMTILLLLIDWNKLIFEKKIGFIKPRRFIF